jgi:hypothetical protein
MRCGGAFGSCRATSARRHEAPPRAPSPPAAGSMLGRCRAALRAARLARTPAAAPAWCREAGSAPLVRDPRFSALTDADVTHVRQILGPTGVITGARLRALPLPAALTRPVVSRFIRRR